LTRDRVSSTVIGVAIRIGIDLVSVADVADALAFHGDRYLQRVFTRREVDECRNPAGEIDPLRLAGRFAAKEAALKALRVDPGIGLAFTSFEVTTGKLGQPELALAADAAELAAADNLGELSVSLTHEGEYAAAVVVAVSKESGP
jgi:holo-[acyl-carrier protein] synthase